MGGLMAGAARALSNRAEVAGRPLPVATMGACAGAGGASSMAEWQISQAVQVLAWCSCAAQPVAEESSHAEEACA